MDKLDKGSTVEMGRLGGKTRAAHMTAKQRSEQARKAAKARWTKKKEHPDSAP
jgi:hypothetical protein